ncbi:response regulator [Sulfitobacter geojensis]|uniref:Response regulator n=1 Tax=Sulfitobacter geojensis TaxID=1342299 RepID=A0AAE2VUZ1_9RHOB|nr:response regulator [Sulfitobacter geojensis]MBM1687824.1 response regulator [Sulfitobacter geojensis]MBM1691891.1 response regulator [Sulfitobacter geojensis]MBM1704057.1 response regulator [Sulfitobacter geojensis]MBM1708115.1 response regulator [Sulfitobacter geojensis]MBM1712180.1 response regulator [Sulfitobacter geojensis]
MSMQKIQISALKSTVKIPSVVSILIVDDERFDRARLRRICDNLDFEAIITEADTLETMGTALQNDRFDLIFLDFNMPDGDGLMALDAIANDERHRSVAVIMVTGDDDVDVAIAAMKNGCSDFVKKDTVSPEAIRRATLNALQKAALNRGLEIETSLRTNIETVLNQFTRQCAEEFNPLLFNMMRQVRGLHSVRLDETRYAIAVGKIERACERMFDFVKDIEDQERKDEVLLNVGDFALERVDPAQMAERKSQKARLFRRKGG